MRFLKKSTVKLGTRLLPDYKKENGITSIPLQFAGHQSYFVVFPRQISRKTKSAGKPNFPNTTVFKTLKGPWEVSFDTSLGGPAKVNFDTLYDWSTDQEDGIKYYSGIATYNKTFYLPGLSEKGSSIFLDLGRVHEMARVSLNGEDLGVVWCAPWQVDISEALTEGENKLEIKVANLWPNRLIGDAALPTEDRYTWTIEGHPYRADSNLMPSGLMGPLTIVGLTY